jgi:hypothetical protein
LKNVMRPRLDEPIPLWMTFSVIFAALYASHFTLLRLPYYWDEAGYYIPAAWDFFRTGSLIPVSTLTNAHPPLPSVYLALWWKVSGFYPEVTREAVLMVAAFGLLAIWRLSMRLVGVAGVGFWTVLLTGLYPVWFAQTTLAHADIFAATCTLWGLVFVLPDRDRKPWAAALWFGAAVLCKETAIAVPFTLAVVNLVETIGAQDSDRGRLRREAVWLCSCVLPLGAWYAYHYTKTGFLFGNPEFLRYNAQATLSPLRVLAAFGHRVLHLTAHMNLFVPVLLTCAALILTPRKDGDGHERAEIGKLAMHRILVLLIVNALVFSVLGGALLTRYLLPMYPLVLLMSVTAFYRRVPFWWVLAGFSAAAFTVGLFINPPYGFAPEDNLAYAHVIRLHQAAIAQLGKRYAGATVLTAWPVTDELTKPELGYVKQAWDVARVEDFTEAQVARAAEEPGKFSAALVFSTKYDPPRPLLSLGPKSQALDEQYFGLHHDLGPEQIAKRLGGEVVWAKSDDDQWVALIRFERVLDAKMESAPRLP